MEANFLTTYITKKGDVSGYGTIYFFPTTMTNLYEFFDIVNEGNDVYINTRKENWLIVTSKEGIDIRFTFDIRGLCVKETSTRGFYSERDLEGESIMKTLP